PEVAGRLPDHHHRLCLSLGRLEGEGVVRQFIIRRILYSIVTLGILSATIFLIVRLTGDPVALMAEASARPEDLDRIRHQWGLDLLGLSIPGFWLGLVLILVFSVWLRWLPASGAGDWRHVIMPALALGWYFAASMLRLTRSSMLEVLGSEYIKLARLKGLPDV